MSKHEPIVVKGNGHFIEGKLATGQTPKPGQCISIRTDGTWEGWNGAADGERDEVVVLCENALIGGLKTDAYANGAQFLAYIPCPGDELQVLVTAAEAIVIGDKLIIKDGTGKIIETTGSPEMEPFKSLEALGTITVDTHCLVRVTGH